MRPKKGDLTFESDQNKSLIMWGADVELDLANIKLATREDIASMGLVTKAEYDVLCNKYNRLVSDWNKLHQIEGAYTEPVEKPAEKPAEKPQPHVWSVGDFALCPDGKVRRVVGGEFLLVMHDGCEFGTLQCTPVPRPPMPELPDRMCLNLDGRIVYSNIYATLESWVVFFEMNNADNDVLSKLLALAEWRKLVDWKEGDEV